MSDLTAWLDGLDAAHKAATPGPWCAENGWSQREAVVWAPDVALGVTTEIKPANAAAIVAEHNALPKLTAALRAVLELAEELQGTAEITGGKVNGFVFADRLRAIAAGTHESDG